MSEKSVASIKVETGIPGPKRGKRPSPFAEVLSKLRPKQSFVWQAGSEQTIYSVARRAGIKVSVSQLNKGSYRVWRKS